MKITALSVLVSTFLIASCFNANSDQTALTTEKTEVVVTNLKLTPVFNSRNFDKPTGLYQSANKNWFVIEQTGLVYHIDHGSEKISEFLDISDKVKSGGEMGLLGFALDPQNSDDNIFYLSYNNHDNDSIISRFRANNNRGDKTSEEIILKIKQPYSNHNGGHIAFGPDGFFYTGFGDGGASGDPQGHAQNIDTLLGAMLRIDVKNGNPYSIPASNPFVDRPGKDEIYAYGLRNPWRWSFDKLTGELWVGDVGQNTWEEIDVVQKGFNYGWNIMEGNHCYNRNNCEPEKYTAPIFEYGRSEGQSITGGFVYRGEKLSALQGYYIYGDFMSGKIWALKRTENSTPTNQLLLNSEKNISSFAQDLAGELYIIDYNGGIYALTSQ